MTIEATITWADKTESPRFNVSLTTINETHPTLELFGPFKNLPNALTAAGFLMMEKIEPTLEASAIAKHLEGLQQ